MSTTSPDIPTPLSIIEIVFYLASKTNSTFNATSSLPTVWTPVLATYQITIPTGQQFPNTSNSGSNTLTYFSSVLSTNDNPILTIQTEYIEYYGNTVIQGSSLGDADWYDIVTTDEVANNTQTVGYVIQGFHPYVRMSFTSNSGAVANILTR